MREIFGTGPIVGADRPAFGSPLAGDGSTLSLDTRDPITGKRLSFLFRPGSKIETILGFGITGNVTQVSDEVSFATIVPGASSTIDSTATSFSVAGAFAFGLRGYRGVGGGKLFWQGMATVAGGIVSASGRAEQEITAPGLRVSPRQSDSGSRGNFMAKLEGTLGYQLGSVIVGLSAAYQYNTAQPFMRLPVNTGRAGIAFRNSHAVAVMLFVKIKLY